LIETLGIRCIPDQGIPSLQNFHLDESDERKEGFALNSLPRWRRIRNADPDYGDSMTVRLDNIRRIGVSTDVLRHPPGRKYISGLCLEFWDLTPPFYAGYWCGESDWLLLNQGDKIEHIKCWHAKNWCIGIRIEKSGSGITAMEVHGDEVSDEVCDKFPYIVTANRFQQLVSKDQFK
jgi:hypothetical protein